MTSSAPPSSKPAVLLLCGLLCDAAIWQPQRTALRDLADMQVMDFAGFDSIAQMAAHVLAVAPPQFALAGHSMGGRVALEIMRQAPARVLRLALLDTGIAPRREREREERLALVRLAHAQGMQALAQRWLPPMLHPDHRADGELMDGLMAMCSGKARKVLPGRSTPCWNAPMRHRCSRTSHARHCWASGGKTRGARWRGTRTWRDTFRRRGWRSSNTAGTWRRWKPPLPSATRCATGCRPRDGAPAERVARGGHCCANTQSAGYRECVVTP